MQVSKWGDSLAIRLPSDIVDALQLKEGDDLEVVIAGKGGVEMRKKRSDVLLANLRRMRGKLPAGFKWDRDHAQARR